MFDSLIKLFEGKNINHKMTLRKQLKNVKDPECRQSSFTRVSQIKERLKVGEEEVENAKVVIMASQDHGIHSFEECTPEGSDYLADSGKKKKLDS